MARSHSENVTKYEPKITLTGGQRASIVGNDKERCKQPLYNRGHSCSSVPRATWKKMINDPIFHQERQK